MKTKLMIVMVALLFVAPLAALAGTADVEYTGNKFYYIGAPLPAGQYDPDDPDPDAAGWSAAMQDGNGVVPLAPLPFGPGEDIVLARRNERDVNNVKYFTVTIKYTQVVEGVGELQYQDANSGSVAAPPSTATNVYEDNPNGEFRLDIKFDPQPDWEWVRIQADEAIILTSITWNTQCYPLYYERTEVVQVGRVPSLTQWGVFVLVLMLAGSAGWILWRRRAHAGI